MAIKLTDKLTAITADKVIVDANQVAGGYMAITSAERAELTDALKVDGVTVYETDTKKTYKYITNNWVQEDQEVAPNTYSSVTVNSRGRVTGGSNPTIPINRGGTGATTRKAAITNLTELEVNPNGSIENDTLDFWKNQGTGIAWYTDTNLLHGQPSQYGFLLNIVVNGGEIWQFWKSSGSNNLSYRSGNGTVGWPTTWVRVIDSKNIGSQSVAEATKATKDGADNEITTTYETKTDSASKLAEAKSYVDEKYVPKQDGPWPNTLFVYSNMDFITDTDVNNVTTNYPLVQVAVNPTPQTIPLRDIATGVVKVGNPQEEDDAVTKKYVDDNYISGSIYSNFVTSQTEKNNDYDEKINSHQEAIESTVTRLNTQYYTKTQINDMEFITLEDIDEICGSSIYDGTVIIS